MIKRTVVVLCAFTTSGCMNTVWIKQKERDATSVQEVAGIPFYVKSERFEQTTKWSHTWIEVTLKIDKTFQTNDAKDKRPTISQTFTRNFNVDQLRGLSRLKQQILSMQQGDDSAVQKLIDDFLAVPHLEDTSMARKTVVSNSINSIWVVDGSRTYYLNAPLPWFGTNTLSHELSSDGTLSKSSSAPDTKIGEGISALIPFKEYFTGKFVTPLSEEKPEAASKILQLMQQAAPDFSSAKAMTSQNAPSFVYAVSVELSEAGYVYTFSSRTDTKPTSSEPLKFDTQAYPFVREAISSQAKSDKKGVDSKSIGFQGSISLPTEEPKK